MNRIEVTPIGFVRGGRTEPVDDDWAAETARIVLDPKQVDARATDGLDAFSHVEVVFHFHAAPIENVQRSARRPRGNPEWPEVGILAQRGKDRPNRIGVSVCELESVDGLELTVRGLDAIDGTPVLDVKPYMQEFAPRGEVRQPPWTRELMRGYWQ